MDIQRAQEILSSKNPINVYYHNNSIWINSVNVKKNTAQVKDIRTSKDMNVNVNDLVEQ